MPCALDNYCYSSGNYYKTQEQAEFARDKQLAIVKINDRIAELNDGWVNGICSYSIVYFNGGIELHGHVEKRASIFLDISTVTYAEKIIEEFRDDLMKYIFN